MRRQAEIQLILENAAFDEYPNHEVARILNDLAIRIIARGLEDAQCDLRDVNGNTVGHFSYWRGDE